MTVLELLTQCQQLHIRVVAKDGDLRIEAPEGTTTPELLAALRSYKAELLALLQNSDQEAACEAYQERAAIIEHEGGQNRQTANMLATALHTDAAIEAWAFFEPDGRVLVDSRFKDAQEAWEVGLGWPDDEEITAAKGKGYQVSRVIIVSDACGRWAE